MAITLADLDRKIKNMTLIRELASDPECLALMRELASPNSIEAEVLSTAMPSPKVAESAEGGTSKGALRDAVVRSINSMNGDRFTIYDLERRMKDGGYSFNASTPSIAINGVVRRLVAGGEHVKVETHGSGSSPTYYRRRDAESSA